MKSRNLAGVVAGVLALSALATRPVGAAEFAAGFDLGLGASDNITRVPDNEVDETMAIAGVGLQYVEETARLDADIDGQFNYVHYLDDVYDSELVGRLDADVRFGLVPDRIVWVVQDNFGQTRNDPFNPVTPENRQDVNYFTTGPDITLRFGAAAFARLSGRYSNTHYEESPFDNDRYSGTLALGRELSQNSSLSLNLSHETLEFDEPLLAAGDYDRQSAYLSYEGQGARTRLSVDAGYSEVDRGTEKPGGALLRLAVDRTVSPASTLTFTLGTQFTDTAERFRGFDSGIITAFDTAAFGVTSDVFEHRYASVGWQFARNRTTLGLSLRYDEDLYERSILLDAAHLRAEFRGGRQVTPRVSLRATAGFAREEFDNVAIENDDSRLGVGGTWNFGRSLSLNLDIDRFDRSGTVAASDYTENRAILTLAYQYSQAN